MCQCKFKNTVMKSTAVVFDRPKQLSLKALELPEVKAGQLEVAVQYAASVQVQSVCCGMAACRPCLA